MSNKFLSNGAKFFVIPIIILILTALVRDIPPMMLEVSGWSMRIGMILIWIGILKTAGQATQEKPN